LKVEREQKWVEGQHDMKRNDAADDNDVDDDENNNNNNNLRFAQIRSNRPRGLVTHTYQSDERFR